MSPRLLNLLWCVACVLVALASAAWSAFTPWGFAPEPEQVEQPICKTEQQRGCTPLRNLT